jgi:hypothetical protein
MATHSQTEHVAFLKELVAPLEARATLIRTQMEEFRRELEDIDSNIEHIRKTIEFAQAKNPELPGIGETTRYADYGLTDAVVDVVNTFGTRNGLTRSEIVKLLEKNGFKSGSKNFYSAVSVTLTRLGSTRFIELNGEGPKRYAPKESSNETLSPGQG